jgi:carbon monoxide dehydrogenase subunit G
MKVEGVIGVPAPRQAVFERLSDARFFASCVDGVQDLTEIDATHYSATFATKIAYLRFTFKVTVAMTKVSPPNEIEATVEGTPLGVVGRLTAAARTELAERDGATDIRYQIDAVLAGKLGSMGEPVLRAKAKEMEKQFAGRLTAAFAEATP